MAPLPYASPDRLVFVWQDLTAAGYPRAPLAGPELQDLRDRSTRFSGFGGIWANTRTLTDTDTPEQLRVGLVTADFFQVLGAEAALGRTFRPGDDRRDPSILLSHHVWARRYGADPTRIGTAIQIDGRPHRLQGVMPEGFRLLLPTDSAVPDHLDAWLLLPADFAQGPRTQQYIRVIGRMKPDARFDEAAAEIAAIGSRMGKEFSDYAGVAVTLYGVRLDDDAMRELRPVLLALFGATVMLLFVACVNAATLLVSRASQCRHEMALRLAIGAGRGRLFREAFFEGVLTAGLGAVAGLFVSRAMTLGLMALRPASMQRIDVAGLDAAVGGFIAVLVLVWAAVHSLVSMVHIGRIDVRGALQTSGKGTADMGSYRTRALLLRVQIAMSLVLLIQAGLVGRAIYELKTTDLGFDVEQVMTFRLSLAREKYREHGVATVFSRELRERLAQIPGVSGVGATSHVPFDSVPNWGGGYLPVPARQAREVGLADSRAVTPGYFEVVRARLLEGRWFTDGDDAAALPVAIVDTRLAERLWPGQSPIGRRLNADPGTTGTPQVTVTVVGLVQHLRHRDISREVREQIYFPAAQSQRNPMTYVLRVTGPPSDVVPQIRAAVASLDPMLPVYDARPLNWYVAEALSPRMFTLVLGVAFGFAALALAVVGVYGLGAHLVLQRRLEFGVRLALGAPPHVIFSLVVSDTGRHAMAATPIGCFAAYTITAAINGRRTTDLIAYVAAVLMVAVSVLIACWIPARRAARTDVTASLRAL
jgi:predicted permease